jgi:2-oxoglutarate dehydrogenase E2 component (dihydrolipoamide succinyltransferase)
MPQLGETVTEGTILRWAKQVGDTIGEDEVLVEISTDKVDTEVPSPASGTILEILVEEGDTVQVGTPMVVIGEAGESSGGAESSAEPETETQTEAAPAESPPPSSDAKAAEPAGEEREEPSPSEASAPPAEKAEKAAEVEAFFAEPDETE